MSYQNDVKVNMVAAFYKGNPDAFLTDEIIAKHVDGTRELVASWRHWIVKKGGHCMEVRTIAPTRFGFRFTGRINKGRGSVKCVDPRVPPATTHELNILKGLINPELTRAIDTMTCVIELNKQGYWTDKQLAEKLGLNVNTAQHRRMKLVEHLELNEHMRGMPGKRERVIAPASLNLSQFDANIGIELNTSPWPKPSMHILKPKVKQDLSLLNSVFQ